MPDLNDEIKSKLEGSTDSVSATAGLIADYVKTVEHIDSIQAGIKSHWSAFDSIEKKRESGALRYGELAIECYAALPHVTADEKGFLVDLRDALKKLNPNELMKNPSVIAQNYSGLILSVNNWLSTQPNASANKEKVLELSRTLYTLLYITQHSLEEINKATWRTPVDLATKKLVNSYIGEKGIAGRLTELSILLETIENKIPLIEQQQPSLEQERIDNLNTAVVHDLSSSVVPLQPVEVAVNAVSDDVARLSALSSEISALEEKLKTAQAMAQRITDNNEKEKLYFVDLIKGPDGNREQLNAFMAQIDDNNPVKQELIKMIAAFDDPTTYQQATSVVLSTASWAFAKPTSLLRSIMPVPEIKFLQQVQNTVTHSVNYIFATADSSAKNTLLELARAESAQLTIELENVTMAMNQLQQQIISDKAIQSEPVSPSHENDKDSAESQSDGLSRSPSGESVGPETPKSHSTPSVAPSLEKDQTSLSEPPILIASTVSDVPRAVALQEISSSVNMLLDDCRKTKQTVRVLHDTLKKSSGVVASLFARFIVATNLVNEFTKEISSEAPSQKKFIDKLKIKFKDTLNETKILIQCKTKLKRIDEILVELEPSLTSEKKKGKSSTIEPERKVDHVKIKEELQALRDETPTEDATVKHDALPS